MPYLKEKKNNNKYLFTSRVQIEQLSFRFSLPRSSLNSVMRKYGEEAGSGLENAPGAYKLRC